MSENMVSTESHANRLDNSPQAEPAIQHGPPVLDCYCPLLPSPQNVLNLFAAEWQSKIPAPMAEFQAGQIPLFDDARLDWGLRCWAA